MKKFFLLAAAAIFAFTACENKQSELNLDGGNVKTATISGKLVYLQDQAGAATQEIALANQRVYFEVTADKYSGAASSNLYFTATTDANGAFTISVPVGAKSISGNLKTDQIKIEKDGKALYLKNTTKAVSVVADELYAEKVIAAIDKVLTDCQGTCTVKGKVTYNAGIVQKGDVKEDGNVAAPAGVKVTISAKYADENTRYFITETKADGTYETAIPCYPATTLSASVTIAQFEADYTSLVNNKYLTVKATYYLAAALSASLKDGEVVVKDITAAQYSKETATTKNTKFKVKGEIKLQAEELTYSTSDKDNNGDYSKINGAKLGSKNYTTDVNGGKFKLEIRHYKEDACTNLDSKIIYDMTIGNKGQYEQEVAMYDSWEFKRVKVFVVIDKFAVNNFKHYYYTVEYQDGETWKTNTYGWCKWSKANAVEEDYTGSQLCSGTYELEAGGVKPDGFFDVTVDGTATFTMSADSKKVLRGAAATNADVNKDGTHTLYAGGVAAGTY